MNNERGEMAVEIVNLKIRFEAMRAALSMEVEELRIECEKLNHEFKEMRNERDGLAVEIANLRSHYDAMKAARDEFEKALYAERKAVYRSQKNDEFNAFCRGQYELARIAMDDTGDDGWWGRQGPTAVEALIKGRDELVESAKVRQALLDKSFDELEKLGSELRKSNTLVHNERDAWKQRAILLLEEITELRVDLGQCEELGDDAVKALTHDLDALRAENVNLKEKLARFEQGSKT